MLLGVVLAGGASSRFGSDKALAEFQGRSLLARAVDTLSGWCEQVVVVGREQAPAPSLPDWPRAGMGPLGGLAAALRFALDENYEAVLSCPVDAIGLPEDLPARLAPGPSYLAQQPVIGLWPATAAARIEALLQSEDRHSMRRFADLIGARGIELFADLPNINTPEDLARLSL